LEEVLRTVGTLHFQKIDLDVHENGGHLRPSEVAADPARVAHQFRSRTHLNVVALHVDCGDAGLADTQRLLRGVCRLARLLTVPLVTIPAAATGTDFLAEVKRLSELTKVAAHEGVLLTVETHSRTLTADPGAAAQLCKRVPGLGLTLDPSHYQIGPHKEPGYDAVFPYVRHVRLRDTGPTPDKFQVRVGQGLLDYGRIVNQLSRFQYSRALTVDIRDEPTPDFPMDAEVRKLKYLLESLI
jgi:sugar phosphate isomerase/epimerase